jgi:phosphoribosyl 1,2-cyclic phosphodiesterase
MRFASLGSGSEGNSLIVQHLGTTLMMDCGFGVVETELRLQRLGVSPERLDAMVVTHEHSDHLGGVVRFARKHRIDVWLTRGTARHVAPESLLSASYRFIDPHQKFAVRDIEVQPYIVPHDASEPVQFVFSDGARRLGVLTDTGCSTSHIEAALNAVDALVLECNHDLDMLMTGPYPPALKRRVAGRFGHLDNLTAAGLLRSIDHSRLKHLIAAHLSKQNNRPDLAAQALASVLGCNADWIGIASQEIGFAWREL